MTNSCFLIQLIDKNNGITIDSLHRLSHDLFTTGRSYKDFGKFYIQNIEPPMEIEAEGSINSWGIDRYSIWLGLNIIPKENFPENFSFYKQFREYAWDIVYTLRFLINLNLKAHIFFYAEWNEKNLTSSCSIQDTIDPLCDSGSYFHSNFNKFENFFPILKKLLHYKPSNKFKAILYNYAHSKKGKSAKIGYFYEFTVLEGIIANWAESNGYSELWGNAISTPLEQQSIHKKLRNNFQNLLQEISSSKENYNIEKMNQLESLRDSYFPNLRKIRRSLKKRFLSYKEHRLSDNLSSNQVIETLKKNFYQIYTRRNEIGHSLENYIKSPHFNEDFEILSSAIKILMDFEIEKSIEGEIDWKFEERENNLINFVQEKTKEKILDKFLFSLSSEGQSNVKIQTKAEIRNLKEIIFNSNFIYHDDNEFDSGIRLTKDLKIYYPDDFHFNFLIAPPRGSRTISIDNKLDCLFFSSKLNSNFIFHSKFYPKRTTRTLTHDKIIYCSELNTENIRTIIKLENVDIPVDYNLFRNIH
jgi:hypothetical protein